MTTMTAPDRISTHHPRHFVGYFAAAAFAIAALWSVLVAEHVTVAAPPRPVPGEPVDAEMHRGYSWFVTTLPQERFNTGIAIVGMLCLAVVAMFLGDRLGRLPGYALGLGAVVWTIGHVMQLGAHRAVGLMATHRNPIETVNAINFTVDMTTEAFEITGFALMGCGLLAFAAMALRHRATGRAWAGTTATAGAVMLLLAVAHITGAEDLATWLQAVGGALLLPAWLVWTARLYPASAVRHARSHVREL